MARDTGAAHKIVSVILRFLELSSAVIVLGLLSRFAYMISMAGVNMDGRLVYAMVVAGIGIVYSIFLCPPFDALFASFPVDFILFIMWLVAYCLLQTVKRPPRNAPLGQKLISVENENTHVHRGLVQRLLGLLLGSLLDRWAVGPHRHSQSRMRAVADCSRLFVLGLVSSLHQRHSGKSEASRVSRSS